MEPCPDSSDLFPLPASLPVMVLSDCYLFPGCVLPLFIFEERYRLMLLDALRSTRMFCVGIRNDQYPMGVQPVTTAGLVSACRKQPDGTSHLMLSGVQRVRFTGLRQDKPYLIADVLPLPDQPADAEEMGALQTLALALIPQQKPSCAEMIGALRAKLLALNDPARVCDVLSFHFVRRKTALDMLLDETCPINRYGILIEELRRAPEADDDDDCC